jgi:diguanylate cyclase (GGDEF)-like protein
VEREPEAHAERLERAIHATCDARQILAAWSGLPRSRLEQVPDDVASALVARLLDKHRGGVAALEEELHVHLEGTVQRLQVAAYTDPLTGLANRRAAEQRLADEVARAARYGRGLCILMADVDGLKATNDRHGHAAGDELLREAAARLRGATRRIDLVARWGGDEFLLICPEAEESTARATAERIRVLCGGAPVAIGGDAGGLSVSIGVAVWSAGLTTEQLLLAADTDLYAAKGRGGAPPSP